MSAGMDAAKAEYPVERMYGRFTEYEVPKKLSWRQRLARMIAGTPPLIAPGILNAAIERENDALRIESPGMRFNIVTATNGKIIAYTPRDSNRLEIKGRGEQYYVVKEGESLLDAIAVCIGLERMKE